MDRSGGNSRPSCPSDVGGGTFLYRAGDCAACLVRTVASSGLFGNRGKNPRGLISLKSCGYLIRMATLAACYRDVVLGMWAREDYRDLSVRVDLCRRIRSPLNWALE